MQQKRSLVALLPSLLDNCNTCLAVSIVVTSPIRLRHSFIHQAVKNIELLPSSTHSPLCPPRRLDSNQPKHEQCVLRLAFT